MASKKLLSLQDVLNAYLESDDKESDMEIDSDNSLSGDNSKEINLSQLIKNFDEKQAVFRDSAFLPATSPPPTTADYTSSCNKYSFFCF